MQGAPAYRRAAAQAGWGAGLRAAVILVFALLASTGHATAMVSHSGGMAMAEAPEMAMACCDETSGAAHATPACGAFFAPAMYQMPQLRIYSARGTAPASIPARHGLTLAPPLTPPRYSRSI